MAEALSGAQRVGKIFGMLRWQGFFRDASGAGWVLLGDAGHFKDPAAGQGIGDAFRQGEALVRAIVRGLEGSDRALDQELVKWGRWRNEDAIGHYWLATDIGGAGKAPTALPEVGKRLLARGELAPLIDLFSHRGKPAQVLTPRHLARRDGTSVRTARVQPACAARRDRWSRRAECPPSTRVPLARVRADRRGERRGSDRGAGFSRGAMIPRFSRLDVGSPHQ